MNTIGFSNIHGTTGSAPSSNIGLHQRQLLKRSRTRPMRDASTIRSTGGTGRDTKDRPLGSWSPACRELTPDEQFYRERRLRFMQQQVWS